MGRTWLEAVAASPDVRLVGVVDLDRGAAESAAASQGLSRTAVATDLAELGVDADAVLDVTVPAAHPAVDVAALRAGLAVLCEKPAAPTVAEALRTAAVSRVTGRPVVVSQSRRFVRGVAATRRALAGLGPVAEVTCDFHRAPRFGGFRERMAHPLLVDMAIHHLDLARLLVGRPATRVHAVSSNPSWSWYDGDATAAVVVEFADAARFVYTGSWVHRGEQGSWNGSWRISARDGSVTWDGDGAPVVTRHDRPPEPVPLGDGPEEVHGSLAAFVDALASGPGPRVPHGEIHDNVHSLALVAAAVRAADTGTPIAVAEVLASAHDDALAAEHDPAVHAALLDWDPTTGHAP